MEEAFQEYASLDLHTLIACDSVDEAARYARLSMLASKEALYDWDDVFHLVLVDTIESALPNDTLVFLTQYPSRIATLAKNMESTPWAQRWGLYMNGIELANCFLEETNASTIHTFMEQQYQETGARRHIVPYDARYLQYPSLPECSGVALGIDRMIMVLLGASSLHEVSPLSMSSYRV